MFPIIGQIMKPPGHTTFFLACGRAQAVAFVFVHGWPELSTFWRLPKVWIAAKLPPKTGARGNVSTARDIPNAR